MFGKLVSRSTYTPGRSLVAPVETSTAGNIVLRVGRELVDADGWEQREHVVLTQREAIELATALTQAVQDSIHRSQVGTARYHSAEGILARQESRLGRAIAALRNVYS